MRRDIYIYLNCSLKQTKAFNGYNIYTNLTRFLDEFGHEGLAIDLMRAEGRLIDPRRISDFFPFLFTVHVLHVLSQVFDDQPVHVATLKEWKNHSILATKCILKTSSITLKIKRIAFYLTCVKIFKKNEFFKNSWPFFNKNNIFMHRLHNNKRPI